MNEKYVGVRNKLYYAIKNEDGTITDFKPLDEVEELKIDENILVAGVDLAECNDMTLTFKLKIDKRKIKRIFRRLRVQYIQELKKQNKGVVL